MKKIICLVGAICSTGCVVTEKEIMFGKWLAFDPIKDHQLKVRKFNIEKRKLLDAEAQKNKK